MAEVQTDIYAKNQIDPLANLSKVYSILNAGQTNQLLQTANKQRQFDLNKAQTDAVIGGLAPLATRDDIDKPTALGNVAAIIRANNIPPEISGPILDQIRRSPDNPKVLKGVLGNLFAIMQGTAAGAPVTGPVQPGTLAPTQMTAGQRATAGTLPVAGGPSATAAASTAGAAAGALLGGEAVAQSDYRRQVTPLEVAIPALQRLGTTGTGPGKEEINKLKSVAVAFGFAPDKWTGSVKDFDEANKYLTDWVRANGDTSTNDKLAASFSSNANVHISNAAAVDVAKTALAIRRMKYMQLDAFRKSGLSDDQFPTFAAKWNAQHDPRAFGWDHMTVDQRKNTLKTVKNVNQFKQDVQDADSAGVLTNQQQ